MKPEQIKALRKELGLTQKEFAEKLDVSDRIIRAWESGDKSPGRRSLKDLNRLKLEYEL